MEDEVVWINAGDDDAGTPDDIELNVVKNGNEIEGFLLNAAKKDVELDMRPDISFSFKPAELLKFDMPSVPSEKDTDAKLVLPSRKSTKIFEASFSKTRWVFKWASDSGARTHQCSYTINPSQETVLTVKVGGLGLGKSLVYELKM